MNVFSKSIGNRHKIQQYQSVPCCHVAAAANIHGPIPFYRTKQLNYKINTWDNQQSSILYFLKIPLFQHVIYILLGLSGGTSGKEPNCQYRRYMKHGFDPRVGKTPWEKGLATHSSILAWRIPQTEEPGGLQSKGLQSQT